MEKKHKIIESRGKLDRTLCLPDLTNEELIKSGVRNQLLSSLSCSEGEMERIVGKQTKNVSNFLEMLRSASEIQGKDKSVDAPHFDWKLKQDTDELRVMYCEGTHGSPFHNILAEGFANGPLDVCLCASWETTLYHKWWPELKLPTFKVLMNTCLSQLIQFPSTNIPILLIYYIFVYKCFYSVTDYLKERMKVPWLICDREALLHYIEIEYLEEDLIIILINTISEKEHADANVDGFSMDEIPEPNNAIRIDLVGGIVMQKVDLNRCYFRIIVTMDVKLDFVHPSLINYIMRQLVGSGHKLFQKAVSSIVTGDEEYRNALEEPMYACTREEMDQTKKTKTGAVNVNEEKLAVPPESHIGEAADKMKTVMTDTLASELTEEEMEESIDRKPDQLDDKLSTYPAANQKNPNQEVAHISPEVQDALNILGHCISLLNQYNHHIDGLPVPLAISEAGIVANEAAHEVNTDMDKTKISEVESPATDSGTDCAASSGTSSDERSTTPGTDAADSRIATHEMPALSTIDKKTLRFKTRTRFPKKPVLKAMLFMQMVLRPAIGVAGRSGCIASMLVHQV